MVDPKNQTPFSGGMFRQLQNSPLNSYRQWSICHLELTTKNGDIGAQNLPSYNFALQYQDRRSGLFKSDLAAGAEAAEQILRFYPFFKTAAFIP
jgi:hypothetical protein